MRADPRSTFGLDVDTGSYSVVRTLLEQDLLRRRGSVRVEEWVNSFDYHDEAPPGQGLGITIEQGPVADEDRPSAHLTLVVDTSGSMDIRERLGLVKSSLALLADTLDDDDTLFIVTYGDEAEPLLEPTAVSETDTILDAIDELRPGGSTNLEAGLRTGYAQATDAFRPDAISTVILASDGVANVGVTGPGRLAGQIAEAGDDGIHLVTMGFGMGNYNDDLMEQLADQGNGFYAYVDTFAEAERLFVEDLTSTLTVVAADARVQVGFDEQQVESYRLLGYENRAIDDDDFTDMEVDAGEVGAGHTVTALYEAELAEGIDEDEPIGEVDLRWISVDDDAQDQATAGIVLADAGADTEALALASVVAEAAQRAER
ncbi:MAG: YfbK domain-containing protein [Nocardioidaceae bacterium]